jgi:NADH-quinone oxidoreductase subunit J
VIGVLAALFLGTTVGQGFLSGLLAIEGIPLASTPHFPVAENVKNVSSLMFTEYLWAFEITSFLIIAAIVGAVVIAKKNTSPRPSPAKAHGAQVGKGYGQQEGERHA